MTAVNLNTGRSEDSETLLSKDTNPTSTAEQSKNDNRSSTGDDDYDALSGWDGSDNSDEDEEKVKSEGSQRADSNSKLENTTEQGEANTTHIHELSANDLGAQRILAFHRAHHEEEGSKLPLSMYIDDHSNHDPDGCYVSQVLQGYTEESREADEKLRKLDEKCSRLGSRLQVPVGGYVDWVKNIAYQEGLSEGMKR
ncbi:hypothetical protein TREMEDRAFT_60466 [Tremella mesenterica DSM 1558]|uniref:uncharacterized protein n=1 Tax=Tremella mesenterica (strain ATCC 24925 / CBS 8224 / DSM 1558 / NBRC 9311 / NRRL Y-6157 / RJB 2259-6 / UBC 559-6) TaxID=578456 RepID=UPI0003F48EE7|nr:uncharacterized protein TREMEDRAFT_60466 [Tremella mesenterica DSM 1558]EIW71542.1 hypothetical protein TREMEDRAFT_60466 [Tremella mesenterica DSM 1558]